MPPQPIIVSDFDGTLIDHTGAMHPADAALLRRGAHPPLVIATGRSLASLRFLLGRNGVLDGGPLPYAALTQNGAVSYRPGEEVFAVHPFTPDAQAALIERARAQADAAFLFFDTSSVYALNATAEDIERALIWGTEALPFTDAGAAPRFTKALGVARRPGGLDAFGADLRAVGLTAAYSLPGLLEINPAGVSKGDMLAALLENIGLAGFPVIAAGDGQNDRELMAGAALSIAPASAPEAVRASADLVLDTAGGLLAPLLAAAEDRFGA